MRRRQLAAAAGLALPFISTRSLADEGTVGERELVLGNSAILSGPLGAAVKDFLAGARLHFDAVSAQGGVNGRAIRLVSLDDELKPPHAVANCKALLAEHRAFAFFGHVGSGTIAASTAVFRESGAPLIGNFAVSDSVRSTAAGAAYFVRATYGNEAEKLVEHLATIGIRRIAVATLANPGGEEVLALVRQAVRDHRLGDDVVAAASMRSDGTNVVEMGRALAAADPQAIIIFVSGPPVAKLMQTVWDAGSVPSFYGMSVVDGVLTAKLLGARLKGLATSQVVTWPWSVTDAAALDYRRLCQAAGAPVGYTGFDGYLNARVAVEGLRRAGRDLRRSRLHAVMQQMSLRLGGLDIDYTGGRHTGSRFVDLVLVTQGGRYLR
jgi:ABC-type branched-subunit amino acid transport system substrate-binding protein